MHRSISRALRRGRWRLLARAIAARAGAVVAGCAAVIVADLLGLASRPTLLALAAALTLGWLAFEIRRLRPAVIASRLDRAARTRDTLGTAVWLASRPVSSVWIDHQLDRAARVAARLQPLPLPATRLAVAATAVLTVGGLLSLTPPARFAAPGMGLRELLTTLAPGAGPDVGEQDPDSTPADSADDSADDAADIETLTAEQLAEPRANGPEIPTEGLAGNVRPPADGREPTEVAAGDSLGERLREPGAEQADAAAADEAATEAAPGEMAAAAQNETAPKTTDGTGMSLPGEEFRWAEAALAEQPPTEEGAQATSGDTSGVGEGGDPELGDPTQMVVERELERLDAQEPSDDEEAEEIERASRAGPSRRGFHATALAGASEPPRPIRRATVSWQDRRRIENFFERETHERER